MSFEGPLRIQGPYSGYGLIACSSFFIGFCTITVSLRLYAKHYLSRARWGWDDYLLVPSLIIALIFFSTWIYVAIHAGGGYHMSSVEAADPSLLVSYWKLIVFLTATASIALTLPRCCVLAAYLRFFCGRKLRILTWTLMAVNIAQGTAAFIVSLTVCVPLQGLWDPDVPAVCIQERVWWAAGTIPVAVMDVFTMALPVSTILQLKRPLNERMALLAVFLAYGFATIAEIIRIVMFSDRIEQEDQTWSFVAEGIASVCEVSSYIIACCVPGLRSLWMHRRDPDPIRKASPGILNTSQNKLFENIISGPEYQLDELARPLPDEGIAGNRRDLPFGTISKETSKSPDVIEVNQGLGIC